VLTPGGWTTHGELRPGDWVYHPSGKPIQVLAISEEGVADYKVKITNGDEIWCHGAHEWEYKRGTNIKPRISEARELAAQPLFTGEIGKRGSSYLMHLRNIDPIVFPEADLPLEPYVLGAWLGDGSAGKPLITHHVDDLEVIQKIQEYGYEISVQHKVNGGTTLATSFGGQTKKGERSVLTQKLVDAGVRGRKIIPENYRRASIQQRLELIAGLIDTDGSLNPDGRYRISNCNTDIIEGTLEILTSLGQKPYKTATQPIMSSSGIQGKQVVYSVAWWPTLDFPVQIPRKKQQAHLQQKRRREAISSVEYFPGSNRLGRCIQVDSEDGLYLVGKNLTPTHNSLLSSRLLPAAYLLQHPERYVAICSYSAELAEGFSREAREFYRNAGGMLDPSNQSVNRWGTEGGGGCWATGIGGSVTGRSASLIIADDTVKGREEADSPRTMEKLWSFYQGSLYTRLEPKHGAIVVVATRWGENDLTGRLLEMEANAPEDARENWTIIDWPAISEDPGSRPPLPQHCEIIPDWREKPGEALCPQRYDTYDLERIRQAVGAREWSALYQQRPAPIGGNMFDPEWWQYYESDTELPVMDRIMLSVDCTFTSNSDSDYVVGTVVGQAGIRFYLIDMYREKTDINGTIAMILRMQNKYQINGTIIELAASGFAAYQLLHTRIPGVIGYKPNDRSKVARLSGIVPVVEAGNVYIPQHATWLDTFLNEFSLFPAAKNDDICDSMAQAINYMNQRTAPQITAVHWGRAAFLPGDLQRIEPW
jgi:predicted phage terminase large subunit-like protein